MLFDAAPVERGGVEQRRKFVTAAKLVKESVVVEKDGAPAVAALYRPIEVVPLIHPADRDLGRLLFVQRGDRFANCQLAKERERAVENASVVRRSNDDIATGRLEPKPVFIEVGREVEIAERAEHS